MRVCAEGGGEGKGGAKNGKAERGRGAVSAKERWGEKEKRLIIELLVIVLLVICLI